MSIHQTYCCPITKKESLASFLRFVLKEGVSIEQHDSSNEHEALRLKVERAGEKVTLIIYNTNKLVLQGAESSLSRELDDWLKSALDS